MANPTHRLSPAWGDSNSILIWKYANNLWLLAEDAGVSAGLKVPKVGSPDNENWAIAINALIAIKG